MHCPTCQHRLSFTDVVKIVNPFNYTCKCCGAALTLGQQGVRYSTAAAAGGALHAGLVIALEQLECVSPPTALALYVATFVPSALAAEWYIWTHGFLQLSTLGTPKR